MSLILDALRKSEAERRRGQAPDLHAELPPVTRHSRGFAHPWWWLAGALALGALLAWAVSQRSPAPTSIAAAPATSTLDPQANGVEDRVAGPPDNRTASNTDLPATVVAPPPQSRQEEVLVAPADIFIPPPLQERTPIPEPVAAATREASAAVPPAASPPTTPPTATAPLLAPAMPATDANAPVALSDLSAAERQQLPPLKVSMHLWASTPAERFAIIDGARVGEGDRIGDAFVESITRDGLVLAWNGRRLRLGIR